MCIQLVELVSLPEYSPTCFIPAWDLLRDNRDFQTMVSYDPPHTLLTQSHIQHNFQVGYWGGILKRKIANNLSTIT